MADYAENIKKSIAAYQSRNERVALLINEAVYDKVMKRYSSEPKFSFNAYMKDLITKDLCKPVPLEQAGSKVYCPLNDDSAVIQKQLLLPKGTKASVMEHYSKVPAKRWYTDYLRYLIFNDLGMLEG